MGDGSLACQGPAAVRREHRPRRDRRLPTWPSRCSTSTRTSRQRRATPRCGCHSVRLTLWWEACGFAKLQPHVGARGQGLPAAHPRRRAREQRPRGLRRLPPRPVRGRRHGDSTVPVAGRPPRLVRRARSVRCCWRSGFPTTTQAGHRRAGGRRPSASACATSYVAAFMDENRLHRAPEADAVAAREPARGRPPRLRPPPAPAVMDELRAGRARPPQRRRRRPQAHSARSRARGGGRGYARPPTRSATPSASSTTPSRPTRTAASR